MKLKEANKKILETAEEQYSALMGLEKENAKLRKEIVNLQEVVSGNACSKPATPSQLQLDKANELSRKEQGHSNESGLALNGTCNSLVHQSISEEEPINAAKTLQFEIERRDMRIKELESRVQKHEADLKAMQDDDLTFGVRGDCEEDEESDIATAANEGLRSLNDELARELGMYKQQAVEAVENLIQERKRSEMELKAFSVALKGVDDLRSAAEQMSRELHFIKKHGYVPPGGLSGEDTSESVRNAMSAIESMAMASQSIDHPSLPENNLSPQQKGFNLWAVMNTIVSPTTFSEEVEVSRREEKTYKKSSKEKKRRKKRGDEGSIISSFF